MTTFREGIEAQPENLAAGAESFARAIGELDVAAIGAGSIVLSGIGASAHALIPAVRMLRAAGHRAFALSSAELAELGAADGTDGTDGTDAARSARLADTFVLVSQSGRSSETLAALDAIGDARVIAVSATPDSPLARAADAWLPLGPHPDTPVSTLSYTATLQTLGLFADALTGSDGHTWASLPRTAAELLGAVGDRIRELAAEFAEVTSVDAVGGGAALASAAETALLVREALRLPATGMETREYLHGPLEAVEPGFGAIVFGSGRERALAAQLTRFGALTACVGPGGEIGGGAAGFALPDAGPLAAPILQILPVQLLVDEVAAIRGLPVGEFRRHQDDTKVGG